MKITRKDDGTRLFSQGYYGNAIRQWPSLAAARADGWTGRVVVRSRLPGWPRCRFNLTMDEAAEHVRDCVALGDRESDLYVNEYLECQPHGITIQGEVFRGPDGLTLHYGTDKVMMRDVIRRGVDTLKTAYRTEAKLLLQHHLDPASYDSLMELLDMEGADDQGVQTSHVVEFTAFDRCIGTTPGRNCLLWEARLY
jgi:hypothetical protein